MGILMWLAPASVLLGLLGLAAFAWTFASNQYDDPDGDAARILLDDEDAPPPAPAPTPEARETP